MYAIVACQLFLKKRYPNMSIGQMLLHTTPLCLTLDDIGFTQWSKHCCSEGGGQQWNDSNGDHNVAYFITALRHMLSFQIPIFFLSLLLFLIYLFADQVFCTRWYDFDGYFEGDDALAVHSQSVSQSVVTSQLVSQFILEFSQRSSSSNVPPP